MNAFIMTVAILSIVIVVVQFFSYFNKRKREGAAGTPGETEMGAGAEAFGTDAGSAEAVAPSE